jgi:hypothetical protein
LVDSVALAERDNGQFCELRVRFDPSSFRRNGGIGGTKAGGCVRKPKETGIAVGFGPKSPRGGIVARRLRWGSEYHISARSCSTIRPRYSVSAPGLLENLSDIAFFSLLVALFSFVMPRCPASEPPASPGASRAARGGRAQPTTPPPGEFPPACASMPPPISRCRVTYTSRHWLITCYEYEGGGSDLRRGLTCGTDET